MPFTPLTNRIFNKIKSAIGWNLSESKEAEQSSETLEIEKSGFDYCPQAVSQLKAYKKQYQDLKQKFSNFISQVPFLPDVKWDEPFMSSPHYKDITNAPKNIFDDLYDAKEEARKKLEELGELSGYLSKRGFFVRDALNPYAEALKEGGITDPELIAERKDIKINLQELLTQDKNAYQQAGLTEWVIDLPDNIKDFKLTKKQLENLKSRIEQGEIPIFMPGRLAQLKGLFDAINQLKPELIQEGKKKNVTNTAYWGYIDKLIPIMIQIAELNKRSSVAEKISAQLELFKQLNPLVSDVGTALNLLEGAVGSIPEGPYLFTTKPEEYNNDITKQKKKLKNIRATNPELSVGCLSIGEYLALQNRFTNRVANFSPQVLIPLDNYHGDDGTFSSFNNLPVDRDGRVPGGFWNSENVCIGLGGFYSNSPSSDSYRISVRI